MAQLHFPQFVAQFSSDSGAKHNRQVGPLGRLTPIAMPVPRRKQNAAETRVAMLRTHLQSFLRIILHSCNADLQFQRKFAIATMSSAAWGRGGCNIGTEVIQQGCSMDQTWTSRDVAAESFP